ncbi:MAG: glycosyl hydrolase, partial [Verrucomicrobia bacterium]|nr:glycosyl hydrolase [Verrucomicrobiota bacterium]
GKSVAIREEIPLRTTFPALPPAALVAREKIVELTTKLSEGGRLAWEVPPGRWTILRLGHTTTGKDNHPAPSGGRGLETDKLSKAATKAHFDALMQKLVADNQPVVGKALMTTHIDSWETGTQNWTPKFREEFRRLRGYDPLPLLPVMTGRIVDSPEVSERFLWDVRMTVSDLLNENYAGYFRTLAHQNGLRLSIEAYGNGPFDDLSFAGRADEPMAEFWSWGIKGVEKMMYHFSCPDMASAAHVYGRPILGAEAFTAFSTEKWLGHPATIKALGDWAFCEGINRFVFHRYALQPWTNPDRAPGVSMGPWGLHYERTQTWWEQSKAWHEYLARCQYLLQQGLFVADLCFLTPEAAPQSFKSPLKNHDDRSGYNFDGCPPEVVLTRMAVQDGRIVLPDGMSYRMLVLPQVRAMTPQLLRKIRDLVQAGATVMGVPPLKAPGLGGYPKCDAEVQALARELWGDGEAPVGLTTRTVGKGRVIWGRELLPPPDVDYDLGNPLAGAKWIWSNDGKPLNSTPPGIRYFRKTITVDGAVKSARLVLTADNTFEAWVNGKRIGSGNKTDRAYNLNIAAALQPGANVIAVTAENTADFPNPAGLIGAVKVDFQDGRKLRLATDAAWQVAKTVADDWKTNPQSAADWTTSRVFGAWGMTPWGEIEEGPGETVDAIPDITIPGRALAQLGVPPDFQAEPKLRYIHKKLPAAEIYFVANPEPRDVEALCTFRVAGKQPELWYPDTGKTGPALAFESKNDRTSLRLRLEPSGSVFVVFREKAESGKQKAEMKNWLEFAPVQEISGVWEVSFDPKWGGPATPVTFDKLEDWSKRSEAGIRYYSGTAIYRKTFAFSNSTLKTQNQKLFLDFGQVAVMAEVKLNGKDLGIVWKPPFRVDITDAVRAGDNTLELQVVNLWVNRQIGDEQLPEDSKRTAKGTLEEWPQWLQEGKPSPTGRYTFTSWRLWKKDDALVESGLLGPVTIQAAERPSPK